MSMPYDLEILLLHFHAAYKHSTCGQEGLYKCVHFSIIYINKKYKQPKCPSLWEWLNKLWSTVQYWLKKCDRHKYIQKDIIWGYIIESQKVEVKWRPHFCSSRLPAQLRKCLLFLPGAQLPVFMRIVSWSWGIDLLAWIMFAAVRSWSNNSGSRFLILQLIDHKKVAGQHCSVLEILPEAYLTAYFPSWTNYFGNI